jgi:hypothetical protein
VLLVPAAGLYRLRNQPLEDPERQYHLAIRRMTAVKGITGG